MVFLIIVVAIVAWVVFAYNRLVSLRNQVDNSWRQIDVQLKRRHDLIPNLVEAVKGYMQFERDTLTQVVEARAKAVSAPDQASRMAAENQITTGLGKLLAVMENYPQLKADENVLKLQEELTTTENQIAFARQAYNDVVLDLNTRIQSFPDQSHRQQFRFQARGIFQGRSRRAGCPQGRPLDDRAARLSARCGRAWRDGSKQFQGVSKRPIAARRWCWSSLFMLLLRSARARTRFRGARHRDRRRTAGRLPGADDCGAGFRRRAIDRVILQRRVRWCCSRFTRARSRPTRPSIRWCST